MSISHGLSLGLFIAACIFFGLLALTWLLSTLIQIVAYRKGQVRFMDLGPTAQWFVLTFFDDGDGGGFA